MSRDPRVIKSTVYSRAKTDGAGASLRAALGGGAASVLPDLIGDLPSTPFVVLRMGTATPESAVTAGQSLTWWIYDAPDQRFYRIDQVEMLLRDLYDGWRPTTLTGAAAQQRIEWEFSSGEGPEDPDLGLLFKFVRFRLSLV